MTQQFEPFQKILVRDNDGQKWHCGFFSHIIDGGTQFRYRATDGVWRQCIPYEGNEHLLGTSTNPVEPEPEFKFGDHVEVSRDRNFWLKAVYYQKSYDPTQPHGVVIASNGEVMLWEHCRKADW